MYDYDEREVQRVYVNFMQQSINDWKQVVRSIIEQMQEETSTVGCFDQVTM